MERFSDRAIEIINDLHTERLDYKSEYIPLIDCAQRCADYEDTGLQAEEISRFHKAFVLACRVFGGDQWETVQKDILEMVDSEPVCRICGCTQNNACLGGCYWVEEDLCSACAEAVKGGAG